jgi:immunoglobulin-like protein involved in spore germination/sporulation and spore germination protein
MSDERRDDEILGRALGRAIETLKVNETPYERSRMVAAPRRGGFGFWQVAGAAAAVVLAVALGAWFNAAREGTEPAPVAASPTPAGTPTPAPTVTPAPTPTPAHDKVDHSIVYFARPDGTVVGVHVGGLGTQASATDRINGRVTVIARNADLSKFSDRGSLPADAFNALQPTAMQGVASVSVTGDVATVDLTVANGDWGVRGTARSLAALEQLVYTATEEPGIHRVLFTQNGGKRVVIDQLVVDRPLAREDVFGYTSRGSLGKDNGITYGGDDSLAHAGGQIVGVVSDGTAASITIAGRSETGASANLPSGVIWLEQADDTALTNGKYALYVQLQWNGGGRSGGAAGLTVYDSTPLRSVSTDGSSVFRIELDDARPWRAYMPSKTQLVVEIGGDPRTTSDRIAATAPKPGDRVSGSIRVTGAARVFEANVAWRLVDASGKTLANGHFLASLGSSALWGTFDTSLAIPSGAHGNVMLELLEVSPKDGTDQGVVAIPLTIP